MVKQVETVDKLPLNFNILYEVVERDHILRGVNYEDEECIECLLCEKHDQRVQHFYCSNHKTVFCRECIKEFHSDTRCFVVDLYEIEKMRKMHKQNLEMNKKQLDKRKDDADISCVSQEIPLKQLKKGDSKWFLKRKEIVRKMKEEKEKAEAERRKQRKDKIDYSSINYDNFMNGELGLSQEQLINFGMIFQEGKFDKFMNSTEITEHQKNIFLALAQTQKY